MILFIKIRFWSTPSKFGTTRIGTIRITFAGCNTILNTWIIWATATVPTYPINVDRGGYPINKYIDLGLRFGGRCRFRRWGRFGYRRWLRFWVGLGFTFCAYKTSSNI